MAPAESAPISELLSRVIQAPIGADVVADYGHRLNYLSQASTTELGVSLGLTPVRALRLQAALELGRRMIRETAAELTKITGPEDFANLVWHEMAHLEQEQLRVIVLNVKNRVTGSYILYQGTGNASDVRTSEVFRRAVREGAMSLAIVHNHPSGDVTPSPEDIRITQQLVDAGNLLDIEVLDHVIVGKGTPRWASLRQRGLGFRS